MLAVILQAGTSDTAECHSGKDRIRWGQFENAYPGYPLVCDTQTPEAKASFSSWMPVKEEGGGSWPLGVESGFSKIKSTQGKALVAALVLNHYFFTYIETEDAREV